MKKWLVFVLCFSTTAYSFWQETEMGAVAPAKAEPKIITSTIKLNLKNYDQAHNPSIIKHEKGFLLTFRHTPDRDNEHWRSQIGVVLLNDKLEPICEPQLLDTRVNNKVPSQSEDARLFTYKGKTHIIFNDNMDEICTSAYQRRDIYIAELTFANNKFSIGPAKKLIHEKKYRETFWQKNWAPFEWNGSLLLSYSITPHEILLPNSETGVCYRMAETASTIQWNLGAMRASACPQLVDGEYLGFFHSSVMMTSPISSGYNLWHYFIGAYTFAPHPPFEITKMSLSPLCGKGFYTNSGYWKRVVFPGGYAVSGNTIYLAYGKDDCEVWIATIDKNALLKSLVPVTTITDNLYEKDS